MSSKRKAILIFILKGIKGTALAHAQDSFPLLAVHHEEITLL